MQGEAMCAVAAMCGQLAVDEADQALAVAGSEKLLRQRAHDPLRLEVDLL